MSGKGVRMPISTTVVGSYTRPRWLVEAWRDHQEGLLNTKEFRRIQDVAVERTIREQEEAGLDEISDGEQRRTSFYEYLMEQLEGFQMGATAHRFLTGDVRFRPRLVGRLQYKGPATVTELRAAQKLTTKPLKVCCPPPSRFDLAYVEGVYPSREAYLSDVIQILRSEYAALLKAGASAVQLDMPEVTVYTDQPDQVAAKKAFKEVIALANEAIKGLPREKMHAHICFGNYKATRRSGGSYATLLPELYDLKVSTYVLEFAHAIHADDLPLLKEFPPPRGRKIALGVIDVRTIDAEPAWLVKNRLLRAAEYLPPEQLIATTDCGFAPTWDSDRIPRRACLLKLKALVEGAKLASQELGLDTRKKRRGG
jgi:5-methyltetrahydropteroyltriglutamate--homocysteine methyltransferase